MKQKNATIRGVKAVTCDNAMVQEYGIKCIENWGVKKFSEYLEDVEYQTKWLQDYANQVIADLKRN